MSEFQERFDQLIEDLGLTLEEREYIDRYKRRRRARRVMNLIGEAMEDRPIEKRKVILRHLHDAVQSLREEIRAANFIPPEGFSLISDEALESLRLVASIQLKLNDMGCTDPARKELVQAMSQAAKTAGILDPEVMVC